MSIYLGGNNITGGFTAEEKKQFNNSINVINEQLDTVKSNLGELEKNVKFDADDLNTAYVPNKTITVRTNKNTKNLPPSSMVNFLVTSFAYIEGQYYRITQYCYENSENLSCAMYVRRGISNAGESSITWSAWRKIPNTSVADVPMTTVSLDSSKFSSGSLRYEVKNGVCYVYITNLNTEATFKDDSMNSILMPMPSSGLVASPIVSETTGATVGLFYINSDYFGLMPRCRIFTSPPHKGYTTFSYLVAES